jgi:hypothetical protein
MPEPTETVFDAVNAALETLETGSNATPEADADADATGADADQELDEEGNPVDPEADAEADVDADAEEGAKTPEEEAAAAAAATAAAAEAAAKGEKPEDKGKKKPDVLEDPIPKDLKPETQTRMRELIKIGKEKTIEAQQATENLNALVDGVKAAGVTPQQYGETLSWLKLFNSGDPAQQAQALELVESVAERLAGLLGKERTVGDPLAGFEDLKEAVKKGEITATWAKQMATQRRQGNIRTEITTSLNKEQQTAEAAKVEREEARVSMNTWEKNIAATDPQWPAKKAMLVPVLKAIFKDVPPKQWLARFQLAYNNAKVSNAGAALAASRTGTRRSSVPANQPLRAGSPAGGGSSGINSMMDAVTAGIAQAKR